MQALDVIPVDVTPHSQVEQNYKSSLADNAWGK